MGIKLSTDQAFRRCPRSIIASITRLITRSKASIHDHATGTKWKSKWWLSIHGRRRFRLWFNLCLHVVSRRDEHVICFPAFVTSDVKFELYNNHGRRRSVMVKHFIPRTHHAGLWFVKRAYGTKFTARTTAPMIYKHLKLCQVSKNVQVYPGVLPFPQRACSSNDQ